MDYLFKPIVLVTGFGPFVNHPINASWEAVKLMNKEEIERKHDVELVQIELPVTYENVDEFVPALWQTHSPKLMIHVGVSSVAKVITIETQAHKKGYKRPDYFNNHPEDNVCPADGGIRMKTKLDAERICNRLNDGCPCETKAIISYNAGRYLCEYTYYTSLTFDNNRTLFVHVPDLDIIPAAATAKALEHILDLCLEQIAEEKTTNKTKSKNIGGKSGLNEGSNHLNDIDKYNDDDKSDSDEAF